MDNPSKLFVIDTKTDAVTKTFEIASANLAIAGDTAFVIGSEFSYTTLSSTINYSMINVKTGTVLEGSFLPKTVGNAIKTPYGIAVDPISGNIYVTDAKDHVSPGKLYCVDKDGNTSFTVDTGDIPAQFAFVYKTTIKKKKKKDNLFIIVSRCLADRMLQG
jgi:DNA-binding beta-propeller fold protein YncE